MSEIVTRVCNRCGTEKDGSQFPRNKEGKYNGKICNSCKAADEKERRRRRGIPARRFSRIEDGKKLCLECGEMKLLEDFPPAITPGSIGLGGVASYCNPCNSKKYRAVTAEDRAKVAETSRKYRIRHRERWLANLRVYCFEYRTRKKVTTDGSVTDEVVKGLYGTTTCYYCKKETPLEDRTIDHKIPLSKEGKHIASNLAMACHGCNSSKQDKTEEEYLCYLKLRGKSMGHKSTTSEMKYDDRRPE